MAQNGTPADRLALELAAGKSVAEAAESAGVSVRTAWRRLSDPAFTEAVAGLRSDMYWAAAGRLADGMTEAADTLRALLAADDARVRLAAAGKLIDAGLKVREAVELVREMEELRDRLAAIENRPAAGRA